MKVGADARENAYRTVMQMTVPQKVTGLTILIQVLMSFLIDNTSIVM